MNAIVAVSADWGIGRDNSLLFHIPEDMRRFRSLTTGGTVIMGRKTLDSMPGGAPLPERRNIVLTRNTGFSRPGVDTVHSLAEALRLVEKQDPDQVWVCGGGEIYAAFLPYCRLCYVTRVYDSPVCDAYFPNLDLLPQWQVLRREAAAASGGLMYQFIDYENIDRR